MDPGSDLDSLPILDTPDKIVAHAYAALLGELLHITINTVSQLNCSMSSLTRYMSKAKLVHLTYVKVVLRYLVGIYNKCRSKRCHLLWSKGTWRGVTFSNDVSTNQTSVRKGRQI